MRITYKILAKKYTRNGRRGRYVQKYSIIRIKTDYVDVNIIMNL